MLNRYSIKIGGASGTGINTVGLILSRAFKRAGLYAFATREYPSLIKGGYASYQLDVSDDPINAHVLQNDLYVAIDRKSFEVMMQSVSENMIFIYDENLIRVTPEEQESLKAKSIQLFPLPLTITAKQVGGNTIMKNSVLLGALWKLIGLDSQILLDAIGDIFNKTKEIEEANKKCAEAGMALMQPQNALIVDRFKTSDQIKNYLSITGAEAVALGAVAAGVRAYFAYPMTPSTPILTTITKFAAKAGIVIKQAEDEITAVNMTIGANHAGTRAMTGTSGGGFDLMAETVSLAGITETPLVIALAQRPGPGTGLPTWTAQADLNIAIFSGHGEYPRIVLAPADPTEAFELTAEAHNLAEKFQSPVMLLTDKHMGESMYMSPMFDASKVTIDRGDLIVGEADTALERFELTESGISKRWLPGFKGNTFVANSDEHDQHGYSVEDADISEKMIAKRMRKEQAIYNALPEPEFFGDPDAEISIVTWGSTKQVVLDVMKVLEKEGKKVNLLNFKYVYPLRTERLIEFANKAKKLMIVENNFLGQFADLIQQKTDIKFHERILKYDGRQFFVDELADILRNK